jgi:hypothetical protein
LLRPYVPQPDEKVLSREAPPQMSNGAELRVGCVLSRYIRGLMSDNATRSTRMDDERVTTYGH